MDGRLTEFRFSVNIKIRGWDRNISGGVDE
jgi:hypothetical protein